MTFIEWWQKLGIFHGRDTVRGLIEPMAFAALTWEAAQPKWQPIETAPLGRTVLVFYDNDSRKKRIIRAQYVNAYTEEASEESIDCGFYDYCGETDEYYTPEGWYELVDNSCDYSSYRLEATNKPTHWMPIPLPPEEK